MRVWEKVLTIEELRAYAKRRLCWRRCWICNLTWDETGTDFVHMVVPNKTYYVCDNCLDKTKEL